MYGGGGGGAGGGGALAIQLGADSWTKQQWERVLFSELGSAQRCHHLCRKNSPFLLPLSYNMQTKQDVPALEATQHHRQAKHRPAAQ